MSNALLGKLRAALLALYTAALPACLQPQAAAAPEQTKPPENAPFKDGVFQVGDGEMHLHCKGMGTPIVVFDSGSGMDGTVWGGVASDLAPLTRACTYDRIHGRALLALHVPVSAPDTHHGREERPEDPRRLGL